MQVCWFSIAGRYTYAPAVEAGTLIVVTEKNNLVLPRRDDPALADFLKLKPATLTARFAGQSWHWPKYSGRERLAEPHGFSPKISRFRDNEWGEYSRIKLFSPAEWDEFTTFIERDALEDLQFPESAYFSWEGAKTKPISPLLYRRDYDPAYGRFIAPANGACDTCGENLFIRQGWGSWSVFEFNDGNGGRTLWRVFLQDHFGQTLIQQAHQTADPLCFSHNNYRQLAIWQAARPEMSWFYCRHKTISRDEAIAALERDLDTLRNTQQLTQEEITERALTWLQEYVVGWEHRSEFREGDITWPRLPDGKVNIERALEIWPELIGVDMSWKPATEATP